MLCPQCGSSVSQEASQCPNCHAVLNKTRRKVELSSAGLQRYTQKLKAISPADFRLFEQGELIGGRYKLGEMLGRGPFGQVYMAVDTEIDVPVAVKVFVQDFYKADSDLSTFEPALKRARKLNHTNLVRVNEHGQHKDYLWVAMQHLEGLSLHKLIKLRESKGEHFEDSEIERIVSQLIGALGALRAPMVNLKANNVIFLPDMLKVTDFYIYQALDANVLSDKRKEDDNPYLAPELEQDTQSPSESADIYSLAAIVSQMAFGVNTLAELKAVSTSERAQLLAVCSQALSADPQARYASLVDFEAALMAALAPEQYKVPVVLTPPPPPASSASEVSEVSEVSEEVDDVEVVEESEAEDDSLDMSAALLEDEADSSDASGPEDDIATLEADRALEHPELGDLLPTSEYDRAKIPVPKQPELKASASTSALIDRNKVAESAQKKSGESKGFPVVTLLFVALGIVIFALIVSTLNKPKEVVKIGDDSSTEASAAAKSPEPTPPVKKEEPAKPDTTQTNEQAVNPMAVAALTQAEDLVQNKALQEASSQLKAEQDKLAAAEVDAAPDMASDEKENTQTKPAAVAAAVTTPKKDASAKVASKADAQTAPKTNCPQGMVLLKSKKNPNTCVDRYEYPGKGKPKTRVTWFQAKKSCESAGKRLCARSEWSRACGGKYPWRGKSWDANKCNTVDEDDFERSLASVGSSKSCRSYSGTYDMVGNVFEWVAEKRIVGGSYNSGEGVASCGYSSAKSPSSSAADIGFRCCADPN